jgi:hypothetical protein
MRGTVLLTYTYGQLSASSPIGKQFGPRNLKQKEEKYASLFRFGSSGFSNTTVAKELLYLYSLLFYMDLSLSIHRPVD